MKRKRALFLLLLLLITVLFAGCTKQEEQPDKIKDLEYTVLEESQVPEELLKKMKEKEKESFLMSYQSDGYLYIAKGYGSQTTSGYSIRVKELYESADGIVFTCELLGPKKNEPVLQVETYPSIVVKTPDLGLELLPEDVD